jgi:hypothetical protein
MWAATAQHFLTLLVSAPLDLEDDLARRMVGRPQGLFVEEEPWGWEATVGVPDERLALFGAPALELRVTVSFLRRTFRKSSRV